MSIILKRAVAVIIFFCLLFVLLLGVSEFVTVDATSDCWHCYYDMDDGTLDVALIGASGIYTFYSHLQAYDEQKFTSLVIGSSAQPREMLPYYFDEICRYDNAALIVVELRNLIKKDIGEKESDTEEDYYFTAAGLQAMRKFSPVRWKGLLELLSGDKNKAFIKYLLPVLEYHDRIYELSLKEIRSVFDFDFVSYHGTASAGMICDVSEEAEAMALYKPDGKGYLSDESKQIIELIAKKAENNGRKVLFLLTPYVLTQEEYTADLELDRYMEEKGYDYLNCNNCPEEIGMDFSKYYYDTQHCNSIGARHFTSWFANYLAERYDLKRNYPAEITEKWETAAAAWKEEYKNIEKYVLENSENISEG